MAANPPVAATPAQTQALIHKKIDAITKINGHKPLSVTLTGDDYKNAGLLSPEITFHDIDSSNVEVTVHGETNVTTGIDATSGESAARPGAEQFVRPIGEGHSLLPGAHTMVDMVVSAAELEQAAEKIFNGQIGEISIIRARAENESALEYNRLREAMGTENPNLMKDMEALLRKATERQIGADRSALAQSVSNHSLELLRRFNAMNDKATQWQSCYPSTSAFIQNHYLGAPIVSELMKQLDGAGEARLKSAAAIALAEHNLPLGAAVLAQVNKLDAEGRKRFGISAFADALAGETWRCQNQACNYIKAAYGNVKMRITNVLQGNGAGMTPLQKIQSAVARQAAVGVLPSNDGASARTKISRGIAAMKGGQS